MNYNNDLVYLQKRVRELEERVEQLRLSRKVLMNLIEKMEKENKKLLHTNYRYARWLLYKNRQIVELESKLRG